MRNKAGYPFPGNLQDTKTQLKTELSLKNNKNQMKKKQDFEQQTKHPN